ncbi:hypothetical protein D9M72_173230 [compost metagenome]
MMAWISERPPKWLRVPGPIDVPAEADSFCKNSSPLRSACEAAMRRITSRLSFSRALPPYMASAPNSSTTVDV